ncbi:MULTISPECIES: hypothetical protein [unclassified Bradyrhizobium]|uniref:hypothetical protein n=1 Tax=unclassified Bradyrhizobium TaxID=2631580 RepID=UPI0024795DD9|nr:MULTISPECIES: hypothetical protein [unclassified Bradyrhizobium]WGS18842.1 hypothetical protein MTX22_30610 [Bradyrhizobium sp. ISRA463]WGS25670.1 hypothetical protein MTX19_28185 [Bradyrhizobium sp. ISRA464]
MTYRANWGVPLKTVQLVWPEDQSFDLARISVLSTLGAALIGLRRATGCLTSSPVA